MDSELIYNKYICANCGAVVLANTIEEILVKTKNLNIRKYYLLKRNY